MTFSLQTTDIDLGDTLIENIFINDYMPMADGTYVKVYLLGYKYASDKDYNIEVNNETISKHLNIPLSDVLMAWDFWEKKGIIKKHFKDTGDKYDYEVEFLNLKQLYIKNNYKPITSKDESSEKKTYSASVEDLIEANNIPSIQNMFNSISYIIRRPLVPNEKRKILNWIYNYNMNPDIIVKAYFYASEKKGKKNVNYVEGIIRNWYDLNITNVEALNEHFKTNDEKFYKYERIMKALGFNFRLPTEYEIKTMDKWFNDWKFTIDVVLKACENTKKTSNPNFNYIDKILNSWFEKGVKNIEDIKKTNVSKSTNTQNNFKANNKNKSVKTKFHNFEQRTQKYSEEELENIAKRKRNI